MDTTLLLLYNTGCRPAALIRSTGVMLDDRLVVCATNVGHVHLTMNSDKEWIYNGRCYDYAEVHPYTDHLISSLENEFNLELVGFDTPSSVANEISAACERLHELVGDDVSDEIGVSISHLTETFKNLASRYGK